MTEPGPTARTSGAHAHRRARRHGVSIVGIGGEALITVGVLVLLFIGWQQGWNNVVSSHAQNSAAAEQSNQWLKDAGVDPSKAAPADPGGTASGSTASLPWNPQHPPVMSQPSLYQPFAVIYVPRFGATWKRIIREGIDEERVLDSEHAGIGHYPGTQMPGQVGNFAVAGHVNGYGNAFIDMSTLRIGDAIYVQTKQGWYTYRFRDYEYVQPNAVSVLLPVPREKSATPENRLITLTTCNPPFRSGERLVAYGVFDSWRPLSAGPPAAIAAQVAAAGES